MSRRANREAPQLDMWATEPATPADEAGDNGDTVGAANPEPTPWAFSMDHCAGLADDPITQAQLRIPRRPISMSAWTRNDYRRNARWWELEARRGYPSASRSLNYARNMRWIAELAGIYGPGSAQELKTRAGAKVTMDESGLLVPAGQPEREATA